MKKLKSLWLLFISMLKIGLFTFGGGYAMINLLENEFIEKRKWLTNEEFLDLVTIAESTPGPIAINCSTYIGYKTQKLSGAIVATVAMCIPSFVIIFVISLFFNKFLENVYFAAAFKGIQICVLFLIFGAGVKMAKKIKKSVFNVVVFAATFISMILLSLFAVNFSSIFYILISGALGLSVYTIKYISIKRKEKQTENAKDTENPENTESTEDTEDNDDSGETK